MPRVQHRANQRNVSGGVRAHAKASDFLTYSNRAASYVNQGLQNLKNTIGKVTGDIARKEAQKNEMRLQLWEKQAVTDAKAHWTEEFAKRQQAGDLGNFFEDVKAWEQEYTASIGNESAAIRFQARFHPFKERMSQRVATARVESATNEANSVYAGGQKALFAELAGVETLDQVESIEAEQAAINEAPASPELKKTESEKMAKAIEDKEVEIVTQQDGVEVAAEKVQSGDLKPSLKEPERVALSSQMLAQASASRRAQREIVDQKWGELERRNEADYPDEAPMDHEWVKAVQAGGIAYSTETGKHQEAETAKFTRRWEQSQIRKVAKQNFTVMPLEDLQQIAADGVPDEIASKLEGIGFLEEGTREQIVKQAQRDISQLQDDPAAYRLPMGMREQQLELESLREEVMGAEQPDELAIAAYREKAQEFRLMHKEFQSRKGAQPRMLTNAQAATLASNLTALVGQSPDKVDDALRPLREEYGSELGMVLNEVADVSAARSDVPDIDRGLEWGLSLADTPYATEFFAAQNPEFLKNFKESMPEAAKEIRKLIESDETAQALFESFTSGTTQEVALGQHNSLMSAVTNYAFALRSNPSEMKEDTIFRASENKQAVHEAFRRVVNEHYSFVDFDQGKVAIPKTSIDGVTLEGGNLSILARGGDQLRQEYIQHYISDEEIDWLAGRLPMAEAARMKSNMEKLDGATGTLKTQLEKKIAEDRQHLEETIRSGLRGGTYLAQDPEGKGFLIRYNHSGTIRTLGKISMEEAWERGLDTKGVKAAERLRQHRKKSEAEES